MKTFAVGHGTRVDLWCEPRPGGKGWVINGAWLWPDQSVLPDVGTVVWSGEVPSPFDGNYNDALAWIRAELEREDPSSDRGEREGCGVNEEVETGTVWQHRNGARYRVLLIANLPDDERYPKTVVYQNVVNDTVWARRYDDWHRSFTPCS